MFHVESRMIINDSMKRLIPFCREAAPTVGKTSIIFVFALVTTVVPSTVDGVAGLFLRPLNLRPTALLSIDDGSLGLLSENAVLPDPEFPGTAEYHDRKSRSRHVDRV